MKELPEMRSKLGNWYFAVTWAIGGMEYSVKRYKEWGIPNRYEEQQLERLRDLEQFLKMTWDEALEMPVVSENIK
jgi:hypothetical protein